MKNISIKYIKILSLLFIIPLYSCKTVGPSSVNDEFTKKFSQQAAQLRNYQQSIQNPNSQINNIDENSLPQHGIYEEPNDLLGVSGPIKKNEAAFETHKLVIKPRKYFTPDSNTLNRGLSNFTPRKIPPDIFEIRYNTNPHPPFKMTGIEFDVIRIPQKDAHGVSSNLSDKQYILAGNNSLQRSIDQYDSSINEYDREFSEILIKEQKELIRKKRSQEIFGIKEEIKTEPKEELWAKRKYERRNDPVNKIISSQVVAYNLYKNKNNQQQRQEEQRQEEQRQNQQNR